MISHTDRSEIVLSPDAWKERQQFGRSLYQWFKKQNRRTQYNFLVGVKTTYDKLPEADRRVVDEIHKRQPHFDPRGLHGEETGLGWIAALAAIGQLAIGAAKTAYDIKQAKDEAKARKKAAEKAAKLADAQAKALDAQTASLVAGKTQAGEGGGPLGMSNTTLLIAGGAAVGGVLLLALLLKKKKAA